MANVWCNLSFFQKLKQSLKDDLARFNNSVAGQRTISSINGWDYVDQMTAEVRERLEDSRGRTKAFWVQKRWDNHCLDCELMIDTAVIVSGSVCPHAKHK